jgi:hypothetical protein
LQAPSEKGKGKQKTQARTSAINENSFQTSCTKAQLPKDTKVQRHKSTGTASNSPETSPKNGAKTQQPNVEKHALKRCCSPETRRKKRYATQRCRDPLLRSHRSQKRNKLFKQGAHHPGTGHIHKHALFLRRLLPQVKPTAHRGRKNKTSIPRVRPQIVSKKKKKRQRTQHW